MLSNKMQRVVKLVFSTSLLGSVFTTNAVAGVSSTYLLPASEWHQIVVPATLSARDGQNTVAAVFADDFEPDTYGEKWVLWEYISDDGVASYKKPDLGERLQPGVGYWIAHIQDASVIIDLPDSSTQATGVADGACGPDVPCIRVPIISDWAEGGSGFSMVGKPTTRPTIWDDLRVGTTSFAPFAPCYVDYSLGFMDPCEIGGADDSGLASQYGYRYDNSLTPAGYSVISYDNYASNVLEDWAGFWFETFGGAQGNNVFLGFPAEATDAYVCPCQFDKAVGVSFTQISDVGDGTLYPSLVYNEGHRGEFRQFGVDSFLVDKPDAPGERLQLGDLSSSAQAFFPGIELSRRVSSISAFVSYDADLTASPGYCHTQVELKMPFSDADAEPLSEFVESQQIPDSTLAQQSLELDTALHVVHACANDLVQSVGEIQPLLF